MRDIVTSAARLTLAGVALIGLTACSNGMFGEASHAPAPTPAPMAPQPAPVAETAPVAPVTIRDVQTALQNAGYYKNQQVDGVWGPHTERAVEAFQRAHNLKRNGQLDVPTLQALNLTGAPPTIPGNNTGNNPPPNNEPANNAPANNEPVNNPPMNNPPMNNAPMNNGNTSPPNH